MLRVYKIFFNTDLCIKGCPCQTRAKTEHFKKCSFCICSQKGGYAWAIAVSSMGLIYQILRYRSLPKIRPPPKKKYAPGGIFLVFLSNNTPNCCPMSFFGKRNTKTKREKIVAPGPLLLKIRYLPTLISLRVGYMRHFRYCNHTNIRLILIFV